METTLGQPMLARPQNSVLLINQIHESSSWHARGLSSRHRSRVAQSKRKVTGITATKVDHEDLEASVLSSVNIEHQEEGEFCCPGQVFVQTDDDNNTILSMTVKDFPGLLRVVTWVLNGLELVVRDAKLKTDEEGFAYNQFWVTDRAGNPLKRSAAELTAERMGDFITYCTPSRKAMEATQYRDGPISVDNEAHPDYSEVTVKVALSIEAALFKVASALTNSGCNIQEGSVKSEKFCSLDGDREFRFLVTDRSGRKLDYQRATSLMFTLGLVFGKAEGPLIPPSTSVK